MDNPEVINILSFCTGYAGLELGLSRVFDACFQCVAVEIEAFACANLVTKAEAGKLGIEALYTDVKTFPAKRFRGCFDIVTAGYPCQPFSHAGKRKGETDPRHLWPFIRDSIEQIEPLLVICENVAGHLSLGFDRVVSDLEDLGYTTAPGIYAAAETGAPHRRERLFVLAYSTRLLRAGSELFKVWRGRGVCQTSQELGDAKRTESGAGIEDVEKEKGIRRHRLAITGDQLADTEKHDRRGSTIWSEAQRPQCSCSLWPARPGQKQYEWECPRTLPVTKGPKPTGWDRYKARISAAAQSELGGTTDGLTDTLDAIANRVDRLRLCGNGVSPPQAAMAINDLIGQILEQLKTKE